MKKTLLLLAILAGLSPALWSQAAKPAKAQAILAFADDEAQLAITDAQGKAVAASEGMVLPVGSVIKTLKTTAEIQLKPNGTIIKLSASTTFKIEALKDGDTGTNDFAVLGGKIRAVAAKLAGATAPGYNVRTPTANCGVRGTDFAIKYDPDNKLDWVCVQEGLVEFTSITTGATIPVAQNQFANTFDDVFQVAPVDPARLAELFSDLDFVKLDPASVPSTPIKPVTQATPAPAAPAPAPAEPRAASPKKDPLLAFLSQFLGLEVGSVTIDGSTYSKAVLSPVVHVDSFRLGLYLPIVYTRDLFDPNDWYRPRGNNEWSFGADQSAVVDKVGDFASDLALKIKYLEWGNVDDPFFLKVGNLRSMSLGHGTVVRNFANDQDFPAVRKVGLNAGVQVGAIGLQGLVDDLAQPTVVGGRFSMGLVGDQVALGLQGTADLALANKQDLASFSAPYNTPAYWGDPVLLVGGVDLQLFQVKTPVFSTTAFADVNTLALYNRQGRAAGISPAIEAGLNTKTLWHDGLGSLGGEAGLYGKAAIVDYRLTFQLERGAYRNALFSGNYYRTRNEVLGGLVSYTTDASVRSQVDRNLTMGVVGDAGVDLFGVVTLGAAYRFPLLVEAGNPRFDQDSDWFRFQLAVPRGKLPLVPVSGSLSYERTQLAKALAAGADLFDARTVFRGEVVWGVVDGMDLVLGVTTAVVRNSAGEIVYQNNLPKVAPSILIDTRVSF